MVAIFGPKRFQGSPGNARVKKFQLETAQFQNQWLVCIALFAKRSISGEPMLPPTWVVSPCVLKNFADERRGRRFATGAGNADEWTKPMPWAS